MIVFMGNFSSKSCSCTADADYGALRAGFTSLARLLELHPRIRVRRPPVGRAVQYWHCAKGTLGLCTNKPTLQ
jgi:hypothetical protein